MWCIWISRRHLTRCHMKGYCTRMEQSEIDVVAATENVLSMYRDMEIEEKLAFYNSWCENYDQQMTVMEYEAPRFGVETLDSVYPEDRGSALVLDVPCGTGQVAEGLQKVGFKNIHGIDGNEGMLKTAESKGLYQRLTQWMITADKPLPLKAGTYDLVTIVGGLVQQHLPWDILPEILRVTKPGGLICFTLPTIKCDYRNKVLASVHELVCKGQWEKIVEQHVEQWQKAILPTHITEEYVDGLVAVYRKK
uniref:methyltransferase-like protein 27 isoform X3 n=1 Tax=Pristiophorus japonicus TaxID=55135 RepID=UPI00398E98B5